MSKVRKPSVSRWFLICEKMVNFVYTLFDMLKLMGLDMKLKIYQIIFMCLYLPLLILYFSSEVSGIFKKRAINKIVMASLFLICGTIGFVLGEKNVDRIILLIAMFFSFLGDVILLWSFKKGGIAFIVGNVFYVIYFLLHFYRNGYSIVLWPIVYAIIYGFFVYLVKSGYLNLGSMKSFYGYMASVIGHGSFGIVLLTKTNSPVMRVLCVGLILFMISDFFIAAHNFHDKKDKTILRINSGSYFIGMMLVALFFGL